MRKKEKETNANKIHSYHLVKQKKIELADANSRYTSFYVEVKVLTNTLFEKGSDEAPKSPIVVLNHQSDGNNL